jgi:5-formyltetrahydrofolate cyclo-ligase
LQKRNSLPLPEADRLAGLAQKHVVDSDYFQSARAVGAYFAIGSEVRLDWLIKTAQSQGKTVALPRIEGNLVLFYEITSLDDLAVGQFGIKEPLPKKPVKELDLLLVPGVAFDKDGYRIGYGKGYYDRFLSTGKVLFSMGVCYSFQLLPKLPQSRYDIRLDSLATDNGVLYF